MKKRKLRIKWTCSNYVHHQHRWKWTAWLCGRLQYLKFLIERRFKLEEEKLYIGTKIITAIPMDEVTFLRDFKGKDVSNQETRPGYKVTYPDGYVSWSPKETFENAYREVTDSEKALF